jgi:hypothetical protein
MATKTEASWGTIMKYPTPEERAAWHQAEVVARRADTEPEGEEPVGKDVTGEVSGSLDESTGDTVLWHEGVAIGRVRDGLPQQFSTGYSYEPRVLGASFPAYVPAPPKKATRDDE